MPAGSAEKEAQVPCSENSSRSGASGRQEASTELKRGSEEAWADAGTWVYRTDGQEGKVVVAVEAGGTC